jgi:O-antigen/teichoic acid export membrane protein
VERLKKLLLSQTIKDTLISFLGLGFSAVIGFVFTVILARTFGPEKFGVFSAVVSLIAIVYSLGDLGIASSLINFIPKLIDKRSALIGTTFWFEIIIGVLILALFSVFAIFHQIIIPGSLPYHLLLAGVLAINYLLISFIQGVFTAERRFLSYSFTQIIDAGVKILIVFVLLSISRLTIETALLANVISTIFALLITFGKELLKINPKYEKEIFHKIFHFAKWIAVSRGFSVFVSRIDVILLNLLSSSYQAGIFAAANRITLLFSLLVSSLGSVINPRFSGFDNKEKVVSYIKKLLGLVSLVTGFMLISALFAKPIIDIVFGNTFAAAIPVFQALTISMIPFIFTLITVPALIYTFNQPKFVARATAIQVVLMVVLEIILIPKLGSFAPPIALGITNSVVLFITGLKLIHLIKSPGSNT